MNVKKAASDKQCPGSTLHREEKRITEDYDCKLDCRNCPFPGAKCYPSQYRRPER